MAVDERIKSENLQYDITKEVMKISAWKYLAGKEVLPSYQSQIMEKAKFSYSPLGQKLIKTNENIKK